MDAEILFSSSPFTISKQNAEVSVYLNLRHDM